jgi:hypothetical protein
MNNLEKKLFTNGAIKYRYNITWEGWRHMPPVEPGGRGKSR